MVGPLEGVRVVEMAGIGPVPFAGMVLADAGADVVRVDRPGDEHVIVPRGERDLMGRGRRSVAVDLKAPGGVGVVLRLVEQADALIEGFRPGVMERLGLGPDACRGRNPGLVYGRMTGYGQDGPLADAAGHDIDYIALAGALHAIGRAGQPPTPPLNLVGDFGGGAMFLAFGVVSAVLRARERGEGQVVDVAMTEGAATLMAPFFGGGDGPAPERGSGVLDTGAHFYEVYETADGQYMAVGAIEPQFYAELLDVLGLDPADLPGQFDAAAWPEMKKVLAEAFASRTRAEWEVAFEGRDACVAPVLSVREAPGHPHHRARGAFVDVNGVVQPRPTPRFEGTPSDQPSPPPAIGRDTDTVLAEAGFTADEVSALRADGTIG